MAIKVLCRRQVTDPQTNERKACGHSFKVDKSMAGKIIRCPGCKQGVEIPNPDRASQTNNTGRQSPKRPVQTMSPLSDGKTSNVSSASSANYQRLRVCEACGHRINSDTCEACGHIVKRRSEKSIAKIKPRPAGMQRWLIQTVSQAMPSRVLTMMIHVGVLAVVSLGSFAAIMAMSNESISPFVGVLNLGLLTVILLSYLALVFKAYQFLIQPGAKIAWFQKPFWTLVLKLARSKNWTDYDSRLSNRNVIKIDDPGFDDQDLAELDGLRHVEVLDLEGTRVSDTGLASIYHLKKLRCLVLRRTYVTDGEVYRFQQAFPSVWIWY